MAFKIIFATGNAHKLEELKEITELVTGSRDFIEFSTPPSPFDPDENGTTFEANSLIKAREANNLTGMMTLADDSGLCVESLDGRPGLHSARYAPSQDEKISKLLGEMSDKNNRRAKFVCAMTLLDKNGEILCQEIGECHGKIALQRSGTNGFGFDPVFISDEQNPQNITLAQMSDVEKNTISHRANALKKVIKYLQNSNKSTF